MKRLKLTFAAVAFLLAAGTTVATHATGSKNNQSNDCSSVKGGTLDRQSSLCVGSSPECCWIGNTEIFGVYE